MKVRDFRESDVAMLRAMQGDYPYPDFERFERVLVVVNDEDNPVMAAGAEQILQMYLWAREFDRPMVKIHALRLLHEHMATELRGMGYHSVEAFLPPSIAEKFGRRLERTFRWAKNWPSWTRAF
ncbi:MAG: hypothetical protein WCA44_09135 [Acidobacteriaceae bacterium]